MRVCPLGLTVAVLLLIFLLFFVDLPGFHAHKNWDLHGSQLELVMRDLTTMMFLDMIWMRCWDNRYHQECLNHSFNQNGTITSMYRTRR